MDWTSQKWATTACCLAYRNASMPERFYVGCVWITFPVWEHLVDPATLTATTLCPQKSSQLLTVCNFVKS